MSKQVKYPQVKVRLTGDDGNAFHILGKCIKAMRKADIPQSEIDAFYHEATSGDYDHLLQTCINTLDCE